MEYQVRSAPAAVSSQNGKLHGQNSDDDLEIDAQSVSEHKVGALPYLSSTKKCLPCCRFRFIYCNAFAASMQL